MGFCIIELKFDEANRAIDYRLEEINPAFERQTGLKGAAGKWVSEVAPGLERHWFDLYGKVALTGEATRFENLAEPWMPVGTTFMPLPPVTWAITASLSCSMTSRNAR